MHNRAQAQRAVVPVGNSPPQLRWRITVQLAHRPHCRKRWHSAVAGHIHDSAVPPEETSMVCGSSTHPPLDAVVTRRAREAEQPRRCPSREEAARSAHHKGEVAVPSGVRCSTARRHITHGRREAPMYTVEPRGVLVEEDRIDNLHLGVHRRRVGRHERWSHGHVQPPPEQQPPESAAMAAQAGPPTRVEPERARSSRSRHGAAQTHVGDAARAIVRKFGAATRAA